MSYRNSFVFGRSVPSSLILSFMLNLRRRSTAQRQEEKNNGIRETRRRISTSLRMRANKTHVPVTSRALVNSRDFLSPYQNSHVAKH